MASSSISRSVQFTGIGAVVRAYQNRNVVPWAIFCNTQFMFKFQGTKMSDGVKMLHDTLDAIADTESPAVYTLKVYEELKGAAIKSNTPDDGSFNFRLTGAAVGAVSGGSNKEILDELKGLHLRIDSITNDGGDEVDAVGQIQRVMDIPGIKELVTGLIGMLMPGSKNVPTALAGIPGEQAGATHSPAAELHSEQVYLSESVLRSLQVLLREDPKLEEHLAKLANMSEKNGAQFKLLIGML